MKRVIAVSFNECSSLYHYFTNNDDIVVGDFVIVNFNGYKKVKVVNDNWHSKYGDLATKWIVGKVDVDEKGKYIKNIFTECYGFCIKHDHVKIQDQTIAIKDARIIGREITKWIEEYDRIEAR